MSIEIKTNGPSEEMRALARQSSNEIHNDGSAVVNTESTVRRFLRERATHYIMSSFDNHNDPSSTEPMYRFNNAGGTYGDVGKRVPSR